MHTHTHNFVATAFLSWQQNITSWLCTQPLYSLNNIPLLPLVIYIAFSHKGQFYEIHLTVVKRDGGYNNLINVLESMLIQMEESFLLLNTAAVWLQAALASVDWYCSFILMFCKKGIWLRPLSFRCRDSWALSFIDYMDLSTVAKKL